MSSQLSVEKRLWERRTRMLTLHAQGVKITNIVRDFSSEYDKSERGLWKDWSQRKRWASQVARIRDPTLIDEMLRGLQEVLPNAWYEYKTSKNPNVKLGALKLAKDTYIDIIRFLKEMGVTVKVPEHVERVIKWVDPEECKKQYISDTSLTQDKQSSISTTQDSESSLVEGAGEKRKLEPMKQYAKQSK